MFCEYCGHSINEDEKFCSNCGAKVASNETENVTPEPTPSKKKSSGFWKAIAIVSIVLIVVLGLLIFICFAIFGYLDKTERKFEKEFGRGEEYFEEHFKEFYDDYFDEFDDEDDDFWKKPVTGRYDNYEGADKFVPGKVDLTTYSSTFSGLKFTLPATWKVYDKADLDDVYDDEGTARTLVNNNLFVYDVYASNEINGSTFYISYSNKDYFKSQFKDIKEFNDELKDSVEDYINDKYKVEYADDSVVTIGDVKYNELACRITAEDGTQYYQYDLTRELNGYFMDISIFSTDLKVIGDTIALLNTKG